MKVIAFALMVAAAASLASAFDIIAHEPSEDVRLKQGESLRLSCTADNDWWEWCSFKHVPTGRLCEFVWTYENDADNVTVHNCDDFSGETIMNFLPSFFASIEL